MTTTTEYRLKYLVPSIAQDINDLCDKVDTMEKLLRAVEPDSCVNYIDEPEIWRDAVNKVLGELS